MKRYNESLHEDERGGNTDSCCENYANPPIPEGYKHVCGEWNNGFVIERCSDGSQFVWIPVGCLDSNGVVGNHMEKFGTRNYMHNHEFWDEEFNEASNDEFLEQAESVDKYGGFYISRYNISISSGGDAQSVKGARPIIHITFDNAKKAASAMEDTREVKSHLTFGAEYDSVLEWFIESNARTRGEIEEDSTNWGIYCNSKFSPKAIVKTGCRKECCTNNIYDFAGNVMELTQENIECVIRGGCCFTTGYKRPAAYRSYYTSIFDYEGCCGFRVVLCIK